jgi:hypothetical protein
MTETFLPTLSSGEEDASGEESSDDEVDESFEFGGILVSTD